MRKALIIATAAVGLYGFQGFGMTAARADAAQRYENAIDVQHATAPQRVQALSQAEGTSSAHDRYAQTENVTAGGGMYGRQYSQAEGNQSAHDRYGREYSQVGATQSDPMYGRRLAQAEGTQSGNTMYGRRLAQAEQTGVDNSRFRQV